MIQPTLDKQEEMIRNAKGEIIGKELSVAKMREVKQKKPPMKNITINLPEIYDENIQKLIKKGVTPSRSEAVRTSIREFLQKELKNLEILGYFGVEND